MKYYSILAITVFSCLVALFTSYASAQQTTPGNVLATVMEDDNPGLLSDYNGEGWLEKGLNVGNSPDLSSQFGFGQIRVLSNDKTSNSGFSSFNSNPASRESVVLGEKKNQNYLAITYNNSAYGDRSNFGRRNTANFFTGATGGMNFFSTKSVIGFYIGDAYRNGKPALLLGRNGYVGVGTDKPKAKLQVTGGDVCLQDANSGIIMTSPDGTCFRVTVNNDGTFSSTKVNCPR